MTGRANERRHVAWLKIQIGGGASEARREIVIVEADTARRADEAHAGVVLQTGLAATAVATALLAAGQLSGARWWVVVIGMIISFVATALAFAAQDLLLAPPKESHWLVRLLGRNGGIRAAKRRLTRIATWALGFAVVFTPLGVWVASRLTGG